MAEKLKETLEKIKAQAEQAQTLALNTTESIRQLLIAGKQDEAMEVLRDAVRYGDVRTPVEQLIEVFREYPPAKICEQCGALIESRFNATNLHSLSKDFWQFGECQPCRLPGVEAGVEKEFDSILAASGVDKKFKRANIADFPQFIIDALPKHQGAYIWGPCGTGKTHLLTAVMRHIAHKNSVEMVEDHNGFQVYSPTPMYRYPTITSIQEVLLEIRKSFGAEKGSREDEIIDQYTEGKYLFLDDIGVEKPTDWALQTIYMIIDRRYRDQKITYFTSNLSLGDLAGRLGDRIASRIAEMCKVIKMAGSDRRLK